MSYTLVDTVALVEEMIISLQPIYEKWVATGIPITYGTYLPSRIPELFLDCEGVNLSREGELCIIQIYCHDTGHTYLIDITTLGPKAFDSSPEIHLDAEENNDPDSTVSDKLDDAANDLVPAIRELNVTSGEIDGKNTDKKQQVAAEESVSSKADVSSANDTLTLRGILESPYVPKVWFDVRNDNDALYNHFQVQMEGVIDLQLMEYAANPWRERRYQPPGWLLRDRVRGLFNCIKFDAYLPPDILTNWLDTKDQGKVYFNDHTKGGGYEVFKKRPLSNDLLRYCVNDVVHMPLLYGRYGAKMAIAMQEVVLWHSNKRVIDSRRSDYPPDGPWKGEGPWYGNDWYNGEVAMATVWAFRHPQVDAQWVYVAE